MLCKCIIFVLLTVLKSETYLVKAVDSDEKDVNFERIRPLDKNDNDPVPEYFDWRDYNMVSPVKDQLNCAACWAFSAIANIESHLKIYLDEEQILSEQLLIDCDEDGNGCGINSASMKVYNGGIDEPKYSDCDPDYLNHAVLIVGYNVYGSAPDWTILVDTYEKHYKIPEDVGVSSSRPDIFLYSREIKLRVLAIKMNKYYDKWNELTKNGYAVNLYVVEGGVRGIPAKSLHNLLKDLGLSRTAASSILERVSKGLTGSYQIVLGRGGIAGNQVSRDTGRRIPYWIIKNSWGTEWGDGGYYYLVRGRNASGIDSDVSFAYVA